MFRHILDGFHFRSISPLSGQQSGMPGVKGLATRTCRK
jgi:hypothetical protein